MQRYIFAKDTPDDSNDNRKDAPKSHHYPRPNSSPTYHHHPCPAPVPTPNGPRAPILDISPRGTKKKLYYHPASKLMTPRETLKLSPPKGFPEILEKDSPFDGLLIQQHQNATRFKRQFFVNQVWLINDDQRKGKYEKRKCSPLRLVNYETTRLLLSRNAPVMSRQSTSGAFFRIKHSPSLRRDVCRKER